MRTALSVTETFHEPGLASGMRRCSKATKVVPAALMSMFMLFGASAYAGDGPYVGIGGGLSMLNDNSVTAPGSETYPALNATATTDDGFAIRGMAGYAFPSGFRVEAEIDYRQAQDRPNGRHKPRQPCKSSLVDGGIGKVIFLQEVPNHAVLPDPYSALPQSPSPDG